MKFEEIMPYIIALIVAVISYVISHIENKKIREKVLSLEEFIASDDTEYYIECPSCGTKICLSKVKIIAKKKNKGE